MGSFTNTAQVWMPDTGDTAELNTLMATMASSIETGLGARMTQAETTKSILATVIAGSTWSLSNGVEATIPFTVNAGGYNDGMTISPTTYVVSITTPGLYNVAVSCMTNMTSGYADLRLYKNAGVIARNLGASTTAGGGFAPTNAAITMKFAAGDTFKATITVNGVAASATIHTGQTTYNVLAMTLIKAL